MQSANKPQSTLMAMAAMNRRAAPASSPMGIKPGAGGGTPMESGLDSHLNFGMGHGHNMFSTTPLMGQAMSGTPLGGNRFAEGGKVAAKPAGPSAKERKEIRNIIENGKEDAVSALRASRSALLDMSDTPQAKDFLDMDFTAPLAKLQGRLAMADGGEVDAQESGYGDPGALYEQYQALEDQLQDESLDPYVQMQIVQQLAEIGEQLEGLGIDVAATGGTP